MTEHTLTPILSSDTQDVFTQILDFLPRSAFHRTLNSLLQVSKDVQAATSFCRSQVYEKDWLSQVIFKNKPTSVESLAKAYGEFAVKLTVSYQDLTQSKQAQELLKQFGYNKSQFAKELNALLKALGSLTKKADEKSYYSTYKLLQRAHRSEHLLLALVLLKKLQLGSLQNFMENLRLPMVGSSTFLNALLDLILLKEFTDSNSELFTKNPLLLLFEHALIPNSQLSDERSSKNDQLVLSIRRSLNDGHFARLKHFKQIWALSLLPFQEAIFIPWIIQQPFPYEWLYAISGGALRDRNLGIRYQPWYIAYLANVQSCLASLNKFQHYFDPESQGIYTLDYLYALNTKRCTWKQALTDYEQIEDNYLRWKLDGGEFQRWIEEFNQKPYTEIGLNLALVIAQGSRLIQKFPIRELKRFANIYPQAIPHLLANPYIKQRYPRECNLLKENVSLFSKILGACLGGSYYWTIAMILWPCGMIIVPLYLLGRNLGNFFNGNYRDNFIKYVVRNVLYSQLDLLLVTLNPLAAFILGSYQGAQWGIGHIAKTPLWLMKEHGDDNSLLKLNLIALSTIFSRECLAIQRDYKQEYTLGTLADIDARYRRKMANQVAALEPVHTRRAQSSLNRWSLFSSSRQVPEGDTLLPLIHSTGARY